MFSTKPRKYVPFNPPTTLDQLPIKSPEPIDRVWKVKKDKPTLSVPALMPSAIVDSRGRPSTASLLFPFANFGTLKSRSFPSLVRKSTHENFISAVEEFDADSEVFRHSKTSSFPHSPSVTLCPSDSDKTMIARGIDTETPKAPITLESVEVLKIVNRSKQKLHVDFGNIQFSPLCTNSADTSPIPAMSSMTLYLMGSKSDKDQSVVPRNSKRTVQLIDKRESRLTVSTTIVTLKTTQVVFEPKATVKKSVNGSEKTARSPSCFPQYDYSHSFNAPTISEGSNKLFLKYISPNHIIIETSEPNVSPTKRNLATVVTTAFPKIVGLSRNEQFFESFDPTNGCKSTKKFTQTFSNAVSKHSIATHDFVGDASKKRRFNCVGVDNSVISKKSCSKKIANSSITLATVSDSFNSKTTAQVPTLSERRNVAESVDSKMDSSTPSVSSTRSNSIVLSHGYRTPKEVNRVNDKNSESLIICPSTNSPSTSLPPPGHSSVDNSFPTLSDYTFTDQKTPSKKEKSAASDEKSACKLSLPTSVSDSVEEHNCRNLLVEQSPTEPGVSSHFKITSVVAIEESLLEVDTPSPIRIPAALVPTVETIDTERATVDQSRVIVKSSPSSRVFTLSKSQENASNSADLLEYTTKNLSPAKERDLESAEHKLREFFRAKEQKETEMTILPSDALSLSEKEKVSESLNSPANVLIQKQHRFKTISSMKTLPEHESHSDRIETLPEPPISEAKLPVESPITECTSTNAVQRFDSQRETSLSSLPSLSFNFEAVPAESLKVNVVNTVTPQKNNKNALSPASTKELEAAEKKMRAFLLSKARAAFATMIQPSEFSPTPKATTDFRFGADIENQENQPPTEHHSITVNYPQKHVLKEHKEVQMDNSKPDSVSKPSEPVTAVQCVDLQTTNRFETILKVPTDSKTKQLSVVETLIDWPNDCDKVATPPIKPPSTCRFKASSVVEPMDTCFNFETLEAPHDGERHEHTVVTPFNADKSFTPNKQCLSPAKQTDLEAAERRMQEFLRAKEQQKLAETPAKQPTTSRFKNICYPTAQNPAIVLQEPVFIDPIGPNKNELSPADKTCAGAVEEKMQEFLVTTNNHVSVENAVTSQEGRRDNLIQSAPAFQELETEPVLSSTFTQEAPTEHCSFEMPNVNEAVGNVENASESVVVSSRINSAPETPQPVERSEIPFPYTLNDLAAGLSQLLPLSKKTDGVSNTPVVEEKVMPNKHLKFTPVADQKVTFSHQVESTHLQERLESLLMENPQLKSVETTGGESPDTSLSTSLGTDLYCVKSPKKPCIRKPDLFPNVPEYFDHAVTACSSPATGLAFDKEMRPYPPQITRSMRKSRRRIHLDFPQPPKKLVKWPSENKLASEMKSFDEVLKSGGSGFRIISVLDKSEKSITYPVYTPPEGN